MVFHLEVIIIYAQFSSFLESQPSVAFQATVLTCFSLSGALIKDAIDLLQGHYIVSISREMTPPSQKGGVEALAVSSSQDAILFSLYSIWQGSLNM